MDEDREFMTENKDSKEKAQFPLRTFKPDYDTATHIQQFLVEYDFIVLMTLISVMTFLTSTLLNIVLLSVSAPIENTSNFEYYILVSLFIMTCYYMIKHNTYPFEFNDENSILIFYAIKAFILSYMILGYFSEYFDFKLELGIQKLQVNTDKLLKVTQNQYLYSDDSFYIALSFISAIMSITVVHHGIKFAYNFFFLNKSHDQEGQNDVEIASRVTKYRFLMTVNFITPLVALFMFVPAISRPLLPSVSDQAFDIIRMTILLLIIILKWAVFHYELQFNFNESYFFIQTLLQNKSEKLFDYVTKKIQLKFINTWITCFQYLSMILIPGLLTVAYMHRYFGLMTSNTAAAYDFSEFEKSIPRSEYSDTVVPAVSLFSGPYLSEALKQVLTHGFIPHQLETAVLSYLLFSYYLSWFIVSTIGLLYYRKFKSY